MVGGLITDAWRSERGDDDKHCRSTEILTGPRLIPDLREIAKRSVTEYKRRGVRYGNWPWTHNVRPRSVVIWRANR